MLNTKSGKKVMLESQHVNDIDLIELAGFHAYKSESLVGIIIVNGKEFEVMNVVTDIETGLDAFTVKNANTGNYTVVYTGTDPESIEDIKTDLKLLGDTPPAQLEDIVSQLSNHKAKSITSLQELSQQVKDNIGLFKDQTARGTI